MSFPTLGRNAAPRPLTAKACVHAWNVHGGFTPEEASIERPAIPSPVFTGRRPIYTPHLAAAALGFIASRTAVRVTGGRCSVAFDLGARRLYRIDSRGKAAPRFWMWVGRRHMDSKPSRWVANACQRRDGTLSVGHDCPAVAGVAGRDVLTELKRGVLDRVAEMGGIPYWLGASFHGAVAQPRRSRPPYQTIAYTLRYGNERVTLRVVTGSGTARPPVDGVPVIQVSPQGTPVLVVADRALPTGLSSDVRGALRPFLRNRPGAKQVPGDLGEEPTRIDTSASVQVWWVGPKYQGRRATVISGAPPGVGLVRYGEPGSPGLFYLASYLPVKKTRCGSLGCASPPSLPAELKAYGESTDTIVRRDGWIVEVLAPPGTTPVNGSALYQALNLAH